MSVYSTGVTGFSLLPLVWMVWSACRILPPWCDRDLLINRIITTDKSDPAENWLSDTTRVDREEREWDQLDKDEMLHVLAENSRGPPLCN